MSPVKNNPELIVITIIVKNNPIRIIGQSSWKNMLLPLQGLQLMILILLMETVSTNPKQ